MYKILKSQFLIVSYLLVGAAAASEVRHTSIVDDLVHVLGQHSHKANSRLRNMRKIFFDAPLSGRTRISSAFGYRLHPVLGKWAGHQGLDYPAPKGTPIRATARGKIFFIGIQNGYGKVILIKHDNMYSTVYAHQSRLTKSDG